MKFELQPYNLHELGKRDNQEDALFPALDKSTPADRLFILCDGMGGHEKGEVASNTVCDVMSSVILSEWKPGEALDDALLLHAIEEAYNALDRKDGGEVKKMGTTMTFLCLHANGATVAHIGDSRVYQLRPAKDGQEAEIKFVTRDHSLVNDLIKVGEITEEEAKNHPQKNVITRAMQPCQERRSKADIAHLTDIQEGDYFYLCSDGMLEQTSDENLLFIVTKEDSTDEEKVEMLRRVTNGNKDNHTAHLVKITAVEGAVVPEVTKAADMPTENVEEYDVIDGAEEVTNIEDDVTAPAPTSAPQHSSSSQVITQTRRTRPSVATKNPNATIKKQNNIMLLLLLVVAIVVGVAAYLMMSGDHEKSPSKENNNNNPTQVEQKTTESATESATTQQPAPAPAQNNNGVQKKQVEKKQEKPSAKPADADQKTATPGTTPTPAPKADTQKPEVKTETGNNEAPVSEKPATETKKNEEKPKADVNVNQVIKDNQDGK